MKPINLWTAAGDIAVSNLLDEIMGTAVRHCYRTPGEIISDADGALRGLLPRSTAVGISLDMISGQKVANSYRGRPIRTRVVIERRSQGWRLLHAERTTDSPRNPRITLRAEHHEAIVRHALRRLGLTDSGDAR